MNKTFCFKSVPNLENLIGECVTRNSDLLKLVRSLKKSDPQITQFVTYRYLHGIEARRNSLFLSKNELAKTCNITPEFLEVIESECRGLNYHNLENVLDYLRYCQNTPHVLHMYKKEFPDLKSNINKRLVYIWLVKTLIHQVLLEKEIEIRTIEVKKINEKAFQEIKEIDAKLKARAA